MGDERTGQNSIRIILADDHAIVRDGLSRILSKYPDINVVAEAGTDREVLQKVKSRPADVLVLDISLPERGGLEILPEVKESKPGLAVLMLSMHSEEKYALRAFQLGAAGYLTKKSASDQLVAAIRRVASGSRYLSSAAAAELMKTLESRLSRKTGRGPTAPHEALSERELEVMKLIVAGRSLTDIADELSLTLGTVSIYRRRLLDKMNMANNADLVYYSIKENVA